MRAPTDTTWKRVAPGIEVCAVRSASSDDIEVRGRTMARQGETRHYAIELMPLDGDMTEAIQRVIVMLQKAVS